MARRRSIRDMIGIGEEKRMVEGGGGGGMDIGGLASAYAGAGGGKKNPPKRPRRPKPDQRGNLIGRNNTNGPAAPVPGQKVPAAPTQKITGRGVGASPQPQAPVAPTPTPKPVAPVSPRVNPIGSGVTNGPAAPVPGQKVPAAPTQKITGGGVGVSPISAAPVAPPTGRPTTPINVPRKNPTPKPVANLPPQIQAFNAAQGKAAGIIDRAYPKKRPRRPKPLPIAF